MTRRKWLISICLASFALGATLFAACGGDDDSSGGVPSGGTGSDEQFVADICKAGAKFSTDIQAVLAAAASLSDPAKAAQKMAVPFQDFSDAFAKAKPPSDLKDWHNTASAKLKDAAAALKKGDLESDIFTQDSPIPDLPQSAQDRLQKIADNNKDCQAADLNFNSSN
jgi:hypothetical protein